MAKDTADRTNGHDRTAQYRDRAREIRRRAEGVSNSAYRQEMMEIAAVLDRWADRKDERLNRPTKKRSDSNCGS